jgi:diphosphomevalonate decarboxylase
MPAATAAACANIAFIKYWGNRDEKLRLPSNPSLSMNLAGLETVTTVEFVDGPEGDVVVIGGEPQTGPARERVVAHLDQVRVLAGLSQPARVESRNNFPAGAGIASSASAFAALSLAATTAAGLALSERDLTVLARLGSGSAARSIPGGFVELRTGDGDGHDSASAYAASIAPPDHWNLVDVIAVVSQKHKAVGSTSGHALARTSPLQDARIATAADRLAHCREAVLARNFPLLADIVETDSNIMHAVMMTSTPALFYWEPITLAIIKAVRRWRAQDGLSVCYTIDAGANVHCLCPTDAAAEVERRLRDNLDVNRLLVAQPGGPARLLP